MFKLPGTRKAAVLFITFLFTVSFPVASQGLSIQKLPSKKPDRAMEGLGDVNYRPGEILVKFADKTKTARKRQLKRSAGINRLIKKIGARHKKDIYLYQVKQGRSMNQVLKYLRARSDVDVAEPNYLLKTTYIPNDPSFGNQWHLNNTGQTIKGQVGTPDADISATDAWDITTGTSVPVAVIDSGIDPAHSDLINKRWQNTGEIAGNGLDDDGNGYVDDKNGYNFAGISQWSGPAGWALGDTDTYPVAQSIKGTGEPLTHIGFLLSKVGAPTAGIVVSVRTSLSGADLATATIAPGDVSVTKNEIYKALSSPTTLTAGQTYYLILQPTGMNASNYYGVWDNAAGYPLYISDPYRDGIEHWYNGATWDTYPTDDFYFTTNRNANPRDDSGHGTHVSGIIGAQGNNGLGTAGVSFGANIMALKAGDSAGWLMTGSIIDAIYYAADNGAKVVNMSFGGSGYSSLTQTAVDYAFGKGAVLLAASGNSYGTGMQYPAGYNNVIGVGATTNQDAKAVFSTYNSSVDLSAPGLNVYSTMPTYAVGMNSYGYSQSYDFMSGTSMATPVAAGAAALFRGLSPGLSPTQVEQYLENNADDLGTPGRDDSFGYGRVNVYQALIAVTPPLTSLAAMPPVPDGDSGWYKTTPTITLTPNETATTYYNWDGLSDVTYTAPFNPPEGIHDLNYFSVDIAGNTETIKNQSFKVDATDPFDPTVFSPSHGIGIPSGDDTIDIDISGATDTVSGVDGFSVSWSQNTTETPDITKDLEETDTPTTSAPLADANWYFNLRTKDNAGNWTATVHLGPFVIDTKTTFEEFVAVYEGFWFETTNTVLSGGAAMVGIYPGDKAELGFVGSALDITGITAPGLGAFDMYIDDIFIDNVSLDNPDVLINQTLTSVTGLVDTTHTLRLVVTAGSVAIDTFKIKGEIIPVAHHSETEAVFSGSWYDAEHPILTGGTGKIVAGELGDMASFDFLGSEIGIIGVKGPDFGIVDIYLDSVFYSTVDLYQSDYALRSTIERIPALPPGPHTVHIVATETKNAASTGTLIILTGFDVW